MKWRVHLPPKPGACANVYQPRVRTMLPVPAISVPTHLALLQQLSACSQRPSSPEDGSSLEKKHGSQSEVPAGASDHTTNSRSTSNEENHG